jgi:VIT family.
LTPPGHPVASGDPVTSPPAGLPAVRHSRHIEQHFTGSESVRDVVIDMSDGLTVPFALAAGLSGAIALVVFEYVKGRFTGARPFRSALQTAAIGSIAAVAAFGIAKLIG